MNMGKRLAQRVEAALLGDKEQVIERRAAQFRALADRAADRAMDRLADALEADVDTAQDGESDA